MINLPGLYRIRQALDTGEVTDLAGAVGRALKTASLAERVRPGMRVAVTAGSRGIDRIDEVLRQIVGWLRGRGALPFIVPAMGSHGGPTLHGPVQVLARLGITEEGVGAPVETDPQTVVLGRVLDLDVHCLRAAASADGVVVVNRVKPHTSFSGDYESGLAKMLAVGLGGRQGAACIHTLGVRLVPRIIPDMARMVLCRIPVLAGIALVENGLDRLKRIEGIPAERIMELEPHLLGQARELRPVLPFEEAHVLVVDRIGKNISGTGMDTHVIGRLFITGEPEPDRPRIHRIAVLRLAPESEGNAYGIGLADVTTEGLIRKTNRETMQANAMASTFVERARVPLALPSEREAIEAAVRTCNHADLSTLKLARIQDTLHLEELHVSKGLLDSLSKPVKVLEGPLAWAFDEQGNLDPACEKKVPE